MSGPKVVRIVTREEILEICEGQLARVEAALAEWIRIGRRNDCIDEGAIAAAISRKEALAALIAADRFTDLQKQAPIEEAFLREDMQSRLAMVAAKQAVARSRARREMDAAKGLLRTLRKGGVSLDADLESGLERGDGEALARGFKLLASSTGEATASKSLAAKLRDGGPAQSFASWLAAQNTPPVDPAVERIETRLNELAAMTDGEVISRLRSRLEEATRSPSARSALLLDGLEVETGRALTEARRRSGLVSDLMLLLAELEAAGIPTALHREGADILDARSLETRLSEARSSLEAHRAEKAAAARRAAVLEGLAGLGYEVNEGMSTTFEQEGQLVLRSATRRDYGVELRTAGGGERMQMRAVAFETAGRGPDPARDRDAETIWCGDVSTLQETLADIGGGLRIEKALPVGATPLKRIAVEGVAPSTDAEAPIRRERTLR